MQLQDLLTPLQSATKGKQAIPTKVSGMGFETLMAEADLRSQAPVANDTQNRTREDRQRSDVERPSRREDRQARNDVERNVDESQVNEIYTPVEQPVNQQNEPEIDEEKALAALAAILEMPVEVVVEILEKLGLEVQDLTDPKAVTKLLQVVLDAETPTELLTDAKFPELFKAVNETMTELAQAAATVIVSNPEAKAKATQAIEVVQTEGLQLISEDGQLVVTDENASEFNQGENQTQGQSTSARQTAAETETSTIQNIAPDILLDEAPVEVLQDQPQIAPNALNMAATKAKVEAATLTSTTANVNPAEVIEQIMSQVNAVTSAGGNFTEMRLTLRPESLGDIVLRVLTQNGLVTAQFEAESQRVKELLEANFNQLRDALNQQGISFSELSVSVRQDGNERANQFEYARQATRRRAAEITGEVEEEKPVLPRHNGVIDALA